MQRERRIARRNAAALVLVALAVVMLGGTALAGHITSNVKSYTGCLVSGDGVIIKVKEGNAPKSACTSGQTEAHFSGGDISKISVGNGLTLPNGGDNGEVRIELAAGQTLPSGCSAGRVAEWNGAAWACGLDDDTTYSAGPGLTLDTSKTPDEFSITPQDCDSGKFATGIDNDGLVCSVPSAAPRSYYRTQTPSTITVVDNYTAYDIVRLDLPAGKYALSASGTIRADTTDGWSDGSCELSGPNSSTIDSQKVTDDDASTGGVAASLSTVSLTGVATLSASASVVIQCRMFSETDQALAESFEIVAIAVS